jgi:hypothetical protein
MTNPDVWLAVTRLKGEAWLADRVAVELIHLAADTDLKMNGPEYAEESRDLQYLLEDLLGRLVDLAHVLGPSLPRPTIGAIEPAYPRLPREVTVEYLRNGA